MQEGGQQAEHVWQAEQSAAELLAEERRSGSVASVAAPQQIERSASKLIRQQGRLEQLVVKVGGVKVLAARRGEG